LAHVKKYDLTGLEETTRKAVDLECDR